MEKISCRGAAGLAARRGDPAEKVHTKARKVRRKRGCIIGN